MSDEGTPPTGQSSLADAIQEVSERSSALIRDEIELAKAEITAKTTKLARGAVVGAVAGIFIVTALLFALEGVAYLLYYVLPIGDDFTYFWGFFVLAAILLVLGALGGYLAYRAIRAGSPPAPSMAIEEAGRIRESVGSSEREGQR